jgi:hypothetical protein
MLSVSHEMSKQGVLEGQSEGKKIQFQVRTQEPLFSVPNLQERELYPMRVAKCTNKYGA